MEKATRQATKEQNTTLVLRTIYHNQLISRAEVARVTRLTRTTVSDIVGELLEADLVQESGLGPAALGKPPIQIEFKAESRQLICVDLGEEELEGALVNLRGEVLRRHTLPLGTRKGQAALAQAVDLLEALWAQGTAPILGIGIGTPGPVDPDRGVVQHSVNREWSNVDLKEILGARFRVPIHIANDSHVAALAEGAYGGHGIAPSLVLMKVGEGVGSGILLKGKLHQGENFSAGEVGHLCVERHGRPCVCGNHGCLETVASLPSLLRLAAEEAARKPGTPFALELGASAQPLDTLKSLQARNDPQATALVRDLGTHLGIAAASLASVLDVRLIILSGMPRLFGEPLLEAVRTELRARILPDQALETRVEFSTLQSDSVLQGACALVLRRELNLP